MPDIRKMREFDGLCTVFVGAGIVISDLTEPAADAMVAAFGRSGPTVAGDQPRAIARQAREGRTSDRSRPERSLRSRIAG